MSEPIWIEEREVQAIHDFQLSEHGGASGIRDVGSLRSALARAKHLHAYEAPDVPELAAAYTAGIVRNHPFVDGNKRTGFVAGVLFLELIGFGFTANEPEATRAVLDLAAGKLDERQYAAWLRRNSEAASR